MRLPYLLLLTTVAGYDLLPAQVLPEPPARLAAQDSATIYLRAAVALADSLAGHHAPVPIAFAIPAYPQDSALRISLSRALSRPPYPTICPIPACPKGAYVLRQLMRHGPALVIVPVSGAAYRPPGASTLADLPGRTWREALEAGMTAPANLQLGPGCLHPAYGVPYALDFDWDPNRGWRLVSWHTLSLCA